MILLILTALTAVGCTETTDNDAVDANSNGMNATPTPPESSSEELSPEEPTSEPESSIQEYDIGDTASDGLTKITVNDVRYATVIDEDESDSWKAEANDSENFVIIDITLENISPNRTRSYGYFWHFRLLGSPLISS